MALDKLSEVQYRLSEVPYRQPFKGLREPQKGSWRPSLGGLRWALRSVGQILRAVRLAVRSPRKALGDLRGLKQAFKLHRSLAPHCPIHIKHNTITDGVEDTADHTALIRLFHMVHNGIRKSTQTLPSFCCQAFLLVLRVRFAREKREFSDAHDLTTKCTENSRHKPQPKLKTPPQPPPL